MASFQSSALCFIFSTAILVTYEQQLLYSITQVKCLINFSSANTFYALLNSVQQLCTEESVFQQLDKSNSARN